MKRLIVPFAFAALAIPTMANADLAPDVAKAVAAMGHKNDAGATRKIFDPLQRLDVVWDGKTTGARPILVFVHGGGFTGGDKHTPGQFTNDNIMKWANDLGMVGGEINDRLAPK